MRIINGKKPLSIAMSDRSLRVPALSVSDNMIADDRLLSLLLRTHTPDDYLIYFDASIELDLFKRIVVNRSDEYKKDDFLCTDLEDGIDKIITKAEKEITEARDAELKVQKEQEELHSYKSKYEDAKSQLDAMNKENNNLRKSYTEEKSKSESLAKELSDAKSDIEDLRNALHSATNKIESMRDDFNAACRKFHINRVNGEWVMLTDNE